jgi:hypothetical protein
MLTCMYALISMPRCSFWYHPHFCCTNAELLLPVTVTRDGDNWYALCLCAGLLDHHNEIDNFRHHK